MPTPLADQARQLRRTIAGQSLAAFIQTYLPHYAALVPSAAHQAVYRQLQTLTRRRGQRLALAAPRGFGKSTLLTLAYVLQGICYRQEQYIVLLSATASQAMQFLDDIRRELTTNPGLLADFPELTGARPRPWTRSEIVTATQIRVTALGVGQPIRGRKHGKDRPTLIIADDLEKAESTFSLERREQLRQWFTGAVLKAGGESTNFLFLGTLYHPFCLLAAYLDPQVHLEWTKMTYKAVTSWATRQELWGRWGAIYNSREAWEGVYGPLAAQAFYRAHQPAMDEGAAVLWPARWTYYALMVQREDDVVSFNCELQNEPINPRDCLFNVEELHYWSERYPTVEALLQQLGPYLEFYGACDPSLGRDTTRGDYTATIILARDIRTNGLYVVEADIARRRPDETVAAIFVHHQRFPFTLFAVEANQFQELLVQELIRQGQERGCYLPLLPITNTGDKLKRIQGLQPWVKNGTLMFHRNQQPLLEQMRFFPKGKHDDGLDALEMAVRGLATPFQEYVEHFHWNRDTEQIEPGLCENVDLPEINSNY